MFEALRSLDENMEMMVDLAQSMLDQLTEARQAIQNAMDDEFAYELMSRENV